MTVAKGQRGDAGAVFDLAPKSRRGVGPASSKRRNDGGRKIGEDKQPNFRAPAVVLILPGVCGKLSRTGQGIFPGSDNFPQSPSNVGALSVRLEIGAESWNGAGLNFRSGTTREDFQPV